MTGPAAFPGLAADRAVDPARFAIGGRTPRLALRPTSRDEAAEVLRAATADRLALVPWGGGVSLAREPAPGRYDLALDLAALDRVVEYDPEDFTLTAECGATIASLRATLAARGQELPLEAPHAARATLGGVLSANASGPRRLRFGAPRDRILGARFALAGGTIARSGGKVVKNVAGYGIHRLLCGSRGGLAVFLEASLKLAPAPEARVALCFDADARSLADASRWAGLPRLEPSLVTVVASAIAGSQAADLAAAGPFLVVVGLEDDSRRVAEQESAVIAALGAPSSRLEGEGATALWQGLADLEELDEPRLTCTTAANTPAALAPLLASGRAPRLLFHAPAGRLHWFQPERFDARRDGFTRIAARGASPGAEPSDSDSDPPGRSGLRALRTRIRAALDPDALFALGERWVKGDA